MPTTSLGRQKNKVVDAEVAERRRANKLLFAALNTPKPSNHDPNGDYIPAKGGRPAGRREYLQEVRGDR